MKNKYLILLFTLLGYNQLHANTPNLAERLLHELHTRDAIASCLPNDVETPKDPLHPFPFNHYIKTTPNSSTHPISLNELKQTIRRNAAGVNDRALLINLMLSEQRLLILKHRLYDQQSTEFKRVKLLCTIMNLAGVATAIFAQSSVPLTVTLCFTILKEDVSPAGQQELKKSIYFSEDRLMNITERLCLNPEKPAPAPNPIPDPADEFVPVEPY